MKLAEVIPITSSVAPQKTLSYFTGKDVVAGSLVLAPLQRREVPALVVSVSEVRSQKSALRQSGYALKKISSVLARSFLTPEFIKTVNHSQDFFITPSGRIFKRFIPKRILQKGFAGSPFLKRTPSHYRTSIFQGSKEERVRYYRSIIRESFAAQKSVLLCLPTVSDAEELFHVAQKGIEEFSFLLHGEVGSRETDAVWKKAATLERPLLFVGTAFIFSIPRNDIGAIIIEKEGSPHYKTKKRPFLDIRTIGEELGKNLSCQVIFGDEVIRTETYWRKERSDGTAAVGHHGRSLSALRQEIIDLQKDTKPEETRTKREFLVFGNRAKTIIGEELEQHKRILLFINRRGHSISMVCGDCNKVMQCEKCSSPLVFHAKQENGKKGGTLVCHHCFSLTFVPERCPVCKSWNFALLGIGIQRAEEELRRFFPSVNIFRIDSDTIKTKKMGDAAIQGFFETPSSLLIATELVFSFLRQAVHCVGVVSVDSLFTIPDFRMSEHIFSLLLRLRSYAKESFFIQTRLPSAYSLLEDVLRGSMSSFYRQELDFRRYFKYPPFSTIIKVTHETSRKDDLARELNKLKRKIASYNPIETPAFIEKVKGKYRAHLILKLEEGTWPKEHEGLRNFLEELGPPWIVEVDPANLL